MAEVETDDSIRNMTIVSEWKKTAMQGVPFYLLVPRGLKRVRTETSGRRVCPHQRYLRIYAHEWSMPGTLIDTCSIRLV